MFPGKKFMAALTALAVSTMSLMPSVARAENPKAQELREIIQSNKYYVEYEVNKKEDRRALAVDGDLRKSFDCEGRRSSTLLQFIPIVGLFAKGSLKLMPEIFYDTNNYYQFVTKKKILRASEEELHDPYLDPYQEWITAPLRIVLPEEFGMFTGDEEIKFIESGTIPSEDGKKEFAFDKYLKVIKNINGENLAKKVYMVCYDEKSEPVRILTLTLDWAEDAGTIFAEEVLKKPADRIYDMQQITIRKFTGELPEKIMAFPNGSKVYGPGLGNMDELLDAPPLLEEHKTGD